LSEFDLIRAHFARLGSDRADVTLGVGDDCALLRVPAGQELAVSIDSLVAGVHFLPDCDPECLGHKALAVGLSDLAAMGAEPAWAMLALTLPAALPGSQTDWLARFCLAFDRLARRYGVALVGGDTTSGPLSVSVQVQGLVPLGQAVRRRGAAPGDLVCVSGTLGDAALALRRLLAGEPLQEDLRLRLDRPEPRVALGLALRGVASAMIDCSDGLAADLGHMLDASGVGAEIQLGSLPQSAAVAEARDWSLSLACGDDYELCFTLPPDRRSALAGLAAEAGVAITVVGRIDQGQGLRCRLPDGSDLHLARTGYDHFGG
jgi:thiamine-monophosphate kinase